MLALFATSSISRYSAIASSTSISVINRTLMTYDHAGDHGISVIFSSSPQCRCHGLAKMLGFAVLKCLSPPSPRCRLHDIGAAEQQKVFLNSIL